MQHLHEIVKKAKYRYQYIECIESNSRPIAISIRINVSNLCFFPKIITGNEKPRISEICSKSHQLQSRDAIQIDATFGHSLI